MTGSAQALFPRPGQWQPDPAQRRRRRLAPVGQSFDASRILPRPALRGASYDAASSGRQQSRTDHAALSRRSANAPAPLRRRESAPNGCRSTSLPPRAAGSTRTFRPRRRSQVQRVAGARHPASKLRDAGRGACEGPLLGVLRRAARQRAPPQPRAGRARCPVTARRLGRMAQDDRQRRPTGAGGAPRRSGEGRARPAEDLSRRSARRRQDLCDARGGARSAQPKASMSSSPSSRPTGARKPRR